MPLMNIQTKEIYGEVSLLWIYGEVSLLWIYGEVSLLWIYGEVSLLWIYGEVLINDHLSQEQKGYCSYIYFVLFNWQKNI